MSLSNTLIAIYWTDIFHHDPLTEVYKNSYKNSIKRTILKWFGRKFDSQKRLNLFKMFSMNLKFSPKEVSAANVSYSTIGNPHVVQLLKISFLPFVHIWLFLLSNG